MAPPSQSKTKRGKHNYEVNLGIVLRELKESAHSDGVTLQQLVDACGVSKRHVYRYLRELEEMGVAIERPQIFQPSIPGGGRYKLKISQGEEVMGETIILVTLGQMIKQYELYQQQIISIYKLIITSMAVRYGFKLPLNFF
ncbi:HTH domain-containing protein [Desulfotomaculum sp. 1211_IL3151]|uniref:HTH domain-containing protein n=1 Tax=Desulfotomaculum sp. 1211_IL3151 TaxID=3084055 RepID=UPI002FD882C6